jgi:hypothetical protein
MVLPYLKGLIIIKCGFFYIALWIYCVFSICGDYICRSIHWFLTSGIRALSRAGVVGNYFLFLQIFFFGEEKRGPRHSRHFQYISVQNLQKRVVDLSSSQKNTQVKKKKIVRNGVRKVKILRF